MYSETRVCIICKKPFEAHHPHQLACSKKCQLARKYYRRNERYKEAIRRGDNPYMKKPIAETEPIHIPSVSLHIAAWKAKLSGKSYGKAEAKIPVEKPNLSIPGDPRCPTFLNLGRVIKI